MVRKRNQCPQCGHIGRTIYRMIDDIDARFFAECQNCKRTWIEVYDFSEIDSPSSLEKEIALMHQAPEIVQLESNLNIPKKECADETACALLVERLETNYLHYRELANSSQAQSISASPPLLRHIRATCATQVFHQARSLASAVSDSKICAKLATIFESRSEHYFQLAAEVPDDLSDVRLADLRHLRYSYVQRGFAEALRLANQELKKFHDGVISHPTNCPKCDETPQTVHHWADESTAEFFVQCRNCDELWVENFEYAGWREATDLDKELINNKRYPSDSIGRPFLKHAPSEQTAGTQPMRKAKSS